MFVQGMIGVRVTVLIFTWFVVSSKHGISCSGDFGKPVRDPCCENVRVHYKQRTVYEILSLQHDDMQRGINCFQRVCPSQFPAFYRVMYVGGFPGTSVSFAVCSDGDHVNTEGNEQSRSAATGRRRKRSLQQRRLKIRNRKHAKRRSIFQDNRSRRLDNSNFVFRSVDKTNQHSKFFNQERKMINLQPQSSVNNVTFSHHFSGPTINPRSYKKKKREADSSRTIFEIPEPRPSIVYTLTGVCFCLRVQSNPQSTGDDESIQPADPQDRRIYRTMATKRNSSNTETISNSSDIESHKNKHIQNIVLTKLVDSYNKLNKPPNKMNGVGCVGGKCEYSLPEMIKRRRKRSNFLDTFMKAVLEEQNKAENQPKASTSTTTTTTTSTTSSPSAIPKINGKTTSPSPVTQPRADRHVHTTRPAHPQSAPAHTQLPKRESGGRANSHSQRGPRHTTTNHDDTVLENGTGDSRGRVLEDEASDDREDAGDARDPEEFNDKLVVFASFSHDIHFIGSISMTVSVASSCRSNLPLSPETNTTSNDTHAMASGLGNRSTSRPIGTTPSKSTRLIKTTSTAHFQEPTSTATIPSTALPTKETIPKSLVEEVQGNDHGNMKDDDDGDDESRLGILLPWQVSGGVTLVILLVLILVLVTNSCRRRRKRRKQKEMYSTVTPESTLQRLQHPPATNDFHPHGAQFSNAVPDTSPQHSDRSVNAASETITIPRTIQAISRNEPPQVINVGSAYPMHIRLRSLSAAAEAARLRGQEALRMLNNNTGNDEEGEIDNTNNALVPMSTRPMNLHRSGGMMARNVIDNNGYSRAIHQNTNNGLALNSRDNNNNQRALQKSLSPAIVVSEGSNTREFDLGQFAVYRNDIMLKLRRCGLRTVRRKRKQETTGNDSSRDYDNDDNDGLDSVYSCYAGGETDI